MAEAVVTCCCFTDSHVQKDNLNPEPLSVCLLRFGVCFIA